MADINYYSDVVIIFTVKSEMSVFLMDSLWCHLMSYQPNLLVLLPKQQLFHKC